MTVNNPDRINRRRLVGTACATAAIALIAGADAGASPAKPDYVGQFQAQPHSRISIAVKRHHGTPTKGRVRVKQLRLYCEETQTWVRRDLPLTAPIRFDPVSGGEHFVGGAFLNGAQGQAAMSVEGLLRSNGKRVIGALYWIQNDTGLEGPPGTPQIGGDCSTLAPRLFKARAR